MAYIYKLYFKGSEKFYIGSTKQVTRQRFAEHYLLLRKGKHNNYMQEAYNQHGKPYLEILDVVDNSIRLQKEQEVIDLLQPELNESKSSVTNKGGTSAMKGRRHTLESLSKMRKPKIKKIKKIN
jgi:hypothetical protein